MTIQTAISTRSLIDSIGANTHIDSVIYGYHADSINYLGFKNIRDSARTAADATTWLQVTNATGAKFDDHIAETLPSGMVTDLGFVTQLTHAGIINFLEAGNEEDGTYPAGLGNTPAITAQFQQQVYATGRPLGLPVINLSFGPGWAAANSWHGDYGAVRDLSGYTDYANAHIGSNLRPGTDWTIQRLNGLARLAAASRPVITTEFGRDENQRFAQTDIARFALDAVVDGIKDGDEDVFLRPVR
jgi:hypothetical protein